MPKTKAILAVQAIDLKKPITREAAWIDGWDQFRMQFGEKIVTLFTKFQEEHAKGKHSFLAEMKLLTIIGKQMGEFGEDKIDEA